LPKIPSPPYSQYPELWSERRGIEEDIGNTELFKFMDKNTIEEIPRQKESPDRTKPF
jgi:hypothetical protein